MSAQRLPVKKEVTEEGGREVDDIFLKKHAYPAVNVKRGVM